MLSLKDKPWFHSMETDSSGRIVIYAAYIDKEVEASVPAVWEGKQVLMHFASAKLATREKFTNNPNAPGATLKAYVPDVDVSDDAEPDIANLTAELEFLESLYNTEALSDIFFEIKDQHNAVTDLSKRYPDARKSLEKLYDTYGFDVLFNEMDL